MKILPKNQTPIICSQGVHKLTLAVKKIPMQNNKNKFQFWSTYIIYAALWLGISVSAAAEKIKTQETDAFEDTVKTDTELSIDIVKQTQPPNHTNNYGARLPQDSGEIATIEAISAYFVRPE